MTRSANFYYDLSSDTTLNGFTYYFDACFYMSGESTYDHFLRENFSSYEIERLDSCTVTVYDEVNDTEVIHDLLKLKATDRELFTQLHDMLHTLVNNQEDYILEALDAAI